ncbi:hypothetical protein JCM18899A_37080 [Nocardioides sp. AN3]
MNEPDESRFLAHQAAETPTVRFGDGPHPAGQAVRKVRQICAEQLADMSEVDLLLALAETGDLIDVYLTFQERGADTADELSNACADLADIEDELMRRGFSHRIFSA